MLSFGNGIFGTPAYWNWSFYLAGAGGKLQQFTLNSSTYKINTSPTSTSATTYRFPGATPSVTTKPDDSDAIVWALDNTLLCTPSPQVADRPYSAHMTQRTLERNCGTVRRILGDSPACR